MLLVLRSQLFLFKGPLVKDVPVFQCNGCPEYLLGDVVMEQVENILERVDAATDLEVLKYAA